MKVWNGYREMQDDLGSGYACIDKEGNALFFVNESEISNISPFSNGYSFIETENAVYQIDFKWKHNK